MAYIPLYDEDIEELEQIMHDEVDEPVVDEENDVEELERIDEPVIEEENAAAVPIRRPRAFHYPVDPLNVPDEHLLRYYRFPREEIEKICNIVRPALERVTRRSHALPVMIQVLTCLRFLASGSFQSVIADSIQISQASCSRIINAFCSRFLEVAEDYINLDLNDLQTITTIKQGFHAIAQFPNVIGCIDCTHINIKKPQEDPQNYVNRKDHHSLNVQAICDHNLKISSLYVMWPGSTHDSFIWEQSHFRQVLETWDQLGWLLGDSGYPCEQRLLTPFRNPATEAEERYNRAHISTRNTIERTFGVLKNRFRCLDASGGTLQYTPDKVKNIIITTGILHNICIKRRIPNIQEADGNRQNEDYIIEHINQQQEGIPVRREVVENYFNGLGK